MRKDNEPLVTVGIVSAQRIDFCLNGEFQAMGEAVSGPQTVELFEGALLWRGQQYRELLFSVDNAQQTFTLNDVTIGNGFHWERHQQQTFLGSLQFVVDAGKIQAINELPVEDYLESVITSEMSVTSSLEFLKAHAVISRSWLLYQKKERGKKDEDSGKWKGNIEKDEVLRWYDREDHALFDVCADDHCQRYQGITNRCTAANSTLYTLHSTPAEAVRATRGQVLTYKYELCDTRFYKCCGGRTEEFQYCWEDTPKPYLRSVECHWCNTKDKDILRQVLNDYDQETIDFHDWTVEYCADELSQLVREKLKMDLGEITDLIPLDRGKSGRIWRLQIVGTKRTVIVGKELEIRRVLSPTHLYSSNFEVEKKTISSPESPLGRRTLATRSNLFACQSKNGTQETSNLCFILHGHGWGHGVGLCQIGAAVMAHEGMNYRDILLHYYPGATITQAY